MGDNIFDEVFRGVYEKEIREFDVKIIGKEYREAFEEYCQEKGIACSEDERWLETGKLKPPVV